MKKLSLFISLMLLCVISCKKGAKEATEAVVNTDSPIEKIDEQPIEQKAVPTFIYFFDKDHMQVVYWTPFEDREEITESYEMQKRVQAKATQYTKMVVSDKLVNVKFVKEQLKDEEGNDMYPGSLGRKERLLPGLIYALEDPSLKLKPSEWGVMYVLTTDDFMDTHEILPIQRNTWRGEEMDKPFSADVIQTLEAEYSMKYERSHIVCQVVDRFTFGILQFKVKGEKVLALKVLIDGDNVYSLPDEGALYEGEPMWNVDDGGIYLPIEIVNVFDGPDGPVVCFNKRAPESCTTG
ncbi:MAG: hypothetical protein Q4A54_01825, partial [Parabacteroides sp.]|nr:hypothetical protein [Parabacteroides sp.]